jgi:hypothetical protein
MKELYRSLALGAFVVGAATGYSGESNATMMPTPMSESIGTCTFVSPDCKKNQDTFVFKWTFVGAMLGPNTNGTLVETNLTAGGSQSMPTTYGNAQANYEACTKAVVPSNCQP